MKRYKVFNGLDVLLRSPGYQSCLRGNVGYLCHNASVTKDLTPGVLALQEILGPRLKKIFGPQHGFSTDVQDNMIETKDYVHPYFHLPVHSLYSHTRAPTDEMLSGVDSIVVDLQDVGTRVYTYISTLYLLMEKCAQKNIKVIVLDRVNPVGAELVEGFVREEAFASFVGLLPIPQRHGLTIGEVARFIFTHCKLACECEVIPIEGWKRNAIFAETDLTWVLPSPNLPAAETCLSYIGTVLFEGTTLSEGRGTTRSLEIIGHPKLEPYAFCKNCNGALADNGLEGIFLRPVSFLPTYDKFQGQACGGFQVHVTDVQRARPWLSMQLICRELYHSLPLKTSFWNTEPYEYEFDRLAIDLINGTDQVRYWVERNGTLEELEQLEAVSGLAAYVEQRKEITIDLYDCQ